METDRRNSIRLLAVGVTVLCCALRGEPVHGQVSLNIGPGTTLKADAVTTSISGNLNVDGRFDAGSGTLVFDGRGTQRIVKLQPQSVNNLRIDKPAGDFILLNDLIVNGSLVIERGYVELDGFTLQLGPRAMIADAERVIGALGKVAITQAVNNANGLDIGGVGFILSARANLGTVSVTRGHFAQRIDEMPGINRYFEVAAERPPNRDVEIRFRYAVGELNGIPENDLTVYRSEDEGRTWARIETSIDEENSLLAVRTRNVSGLWTAGSRTIRVPVTINDLTASVRRHEAVLSWTSVTHTEISGFQIQVHDGDRFEPVDFVELPVVATGAHSFSHTVAGLRPGRHVLRVVPVASGKALDVTKEVEVMIDLFGDFTLTEPFPNPFNSQTSIKLVVAEPQRVQVEVFDIQGRRVASLHEGHLSAGEEHEFTFLGEGLPSSVYLFRISAEAFSATRRVMLVR